MKKLAQMLICTVKDIRRLLREIADFTKLELSGKTKKKVHDVLNKEYYDLCEKDLPFDGEYLYRSLYIEAGKREETHTLRLREKQMNALVKALGYDDYDNFEQHKHSEITEALANCAGTWYSYVRCNSGKDFILRSPVEIKPLRKRMMMTLYGPQRKFTGELVAEKENLFCQLRSEKVKRLYMIFKTGLSIRPRVLQGVFCGLSTSGEPIDGREVIVKQDAKLDTLTCARESIQDWETSDSEEKREIALYFGDASRSILKAGASVRYALDDLRSKQ